MATPPRVTGTLSSIHTDLPAFQSPSADLAHLRPMPDSTAMSTCGLEGHECIRDEGREGGMAPEQLCHHVPPPPNPALSPEDHTDPVRSYMARQPIFISILVHDGKERAEKRNRNKAQGQQTEGGLNKVGIRGQRSWLSRPQLAMASRGSTSKGSLPTPWAGVGMGIHPQPPHRDAPYSLPVALISFFFPIYRVRTALSKLQGHTEHSRCHRGTHGSNSLAH